MLLEFVSLLKYKNLSKRYSRVFSGLKFCFLLIINIFEDKVSQKQDLYYLI